MAEYVQQTGKTPRRYAELAYQAIKDALLAGEYKAGQRLPIDDIARQIGASRQPVMDAVRRLESEGFIDVIPQVGSRVVQVSPSDIADFFDYFAGTEGFFARLAAERGTAAEVARLRRIAADYSPDTASGLPAGEIARRYMRHNREFHGQIHLMSRSPLLHQVAMGLWDKSDFYLSALSEAQPFAAREHDAVDEHQEVLEAIARHDGEAAYRLMRRHVASFADALLSRRAPA